MKKTKFMYMSLALASACIGLASCGAKSKVTTRTSDLGVKLSVDQSKYKFKVGDATNGNITFYSVEPSKDEKTNEYNQDDFGNYYYDPVVIGTISMKGKQSINYLPTPQRKGYKFVGWYVDAGLGTEFYYKTMPEGANLVAYARWELDQDTIYVAPEGSPFATGKTPGKALSLNEAARVYKPGARIVFAEGTYTPKDTITLGNNGSKDKVTVIEGNGATINFKQDEADSNYGIKLTGDYTNISDLTIRGAGDNGIMIGSSNNKIENCVFTECHDTGCQISRYADGVQPFIDSWPSNNLILNCTSYNNCDNAGEDADGFAAKLTVGQGNIFDGCLAYWNVDDGWDLYAKADSGRIGTVTIRNCASFANGHHLKDGAVDESFDGDGNGFKLGGSSVPGEVIVDNCIAAYNYAHGFTDNSNPGTIAISNCTSINNGQYGNKAYDNFNLNRDSLVKNKNYYSGLLSFYNNKSKNNYTDPTDEFNGSISDSVLYQAKVPYFANGPVSAQSGKAFSTSKNVKEYAMNAAAVDYTDPKDLIPTLGTNWHKKLRNADGSLNLRTYWAKNDSKLGDAANKVGADLAKTSADQYQHDTLAEVNASATKDDELLRQVSNALNLAVNKDFIYSDIYLPTADRGATITWTSSKPNLLTISDDETSIPNSLSFKYAKVAPRIDADEKVTLTATIKVGKKTATKSFEVTLQGLDPRIGKITGIDDLTQLNNIDLPNLKTYNVYDYVSTGLVLNDDTDYKTSIKIEYSNEYYAKPEEGTYSDATALDKSKCGTYKVTYTFKVDGYPDTVVTRYITLVNSAETYEVCDAKTALGYIIDDNLALSVNANYGNGKVYAIASSEDYADADLTSAFAEKIKNGSLETAVSSVVSADITDRDFALSVDLNSSYVAETSVYAYLVIVNENGTGAVYKTAEIKPTIAISTVEDLKDAITNKDNNSKAYKLANDIDCGFAQWYQDANSSIFKGYFDGGNHTISNLNIEVKGTDGGGLFFKVDKQAIIKNLGLTEVHVAENDEEAKTSDEFGKTGILVGEIKGGCTIENIYIHNCGVKAYQRVGGIAGQYSGNSDFSPATCKISNVVIDYDVLGKDAAYSINALYEGKDSEGNATSRGGKYVGGIIAHVQLAGGSQATTLEIDNCFVGIPLFTCNQYSGGIVGRIDPKNEDNTLKITNCVFAGSLSSRSSYAAGILGGRSSGPMVTIKNCVNVGRISGSSIGMIVSQQLCNKQTAGTEKWYSINTDYVDMSNCFYTIADYDPSSGDYNNEDEYYAAQVLHNEYNGTAVYSSTIRNIEWWKSTVGIDTENIFDISTSTGIKFTLKAFNK